MDAVLDLAEAIIIAVCFFVCVLLWGCGPKPAPTIKRPDIVVTQRACLAEEPPEPPPGITWTKCSKDQAREDACSRLDNKSARLFFVYLADLVRYGRDAYDHCGPVPAKETK